MPTPHRIPEIIETDRLILRCPQRGDGTQYFQAMNETFDQLKPWFGPWAKDLPSKEQADKMVEEARDKFLKAEELTYFVFTQSHETLIGRASINRVDWSVPKAMLGYWTRSTHQRMGYAGEFIRCINALAMEHLQFQRLELYIDPRNQPSINLAAKLGYCLEGRMRNHSHDNFGQMKDYLVYSMTPADYFEMVAFAATSAQSPVSPMYVTAPGPFCPIPLRAPER